MSVEIFGHTSKGEAVRSVTIEGGGQIAELIEWGAAMRSLRLEGVDRSLVLGLRDLEAYEAFGAAHVGAVAGRMANRIAGGRFEIDGVAHCADRNIGGATTLHGGVGGFGRCVWRLTDHGPAHAEFTIRHEDGEQGFPGAIEARCRYAIDETGLSVALTATAEAPTLCNMAQHNYWNLSGESRIDGHALTLLSERYTPLGPDMTPTGEVDDARGDLDFSAPRRVGAQDIDLNFLLAEKRRSTPAYAARLEAGGVALEVWTTEPGLQVYTGDNLPDAVPAADGGVFGTRAGICLEAQLWPDAPNHPEFPSALLRPGETYRQITRWVIAEV